MSEAQAEHRGWEIENSYHPHFLDDAEYDVAEDTEGSSGAVWGVTILGAALLVGTFLLGKWLEPPVVTLPSPPAPQAPQVMNNNTIPVYLPAIPPGWSVTCIYADGGKKIIRPNWDNPACRGK